MQHRTVDGDAGCLIAPSCNTTPIKTDVRRYAWLNLGIDLRFPKYVRQARSSRDCSDLQSIQQRSGRNLLRA